MPKVQAPAQVLKLIAPAQVKLTESVQLDRDTYHKDDVVTLEKHLAANLVRAKKATILNGPLVESANPYVKVKAEAKEVEEAEQEPTKATAAPTAETTDQRK